MLSDIHFICRRWNQMESLVASSPIESFNQFASLLWYEPNLSCHFDRPSSASHRACALHRLGAANSGIFLDLKLRFSFFFFLGSQIGSVKLSSNLHRVF